VKHISWGPLLRRQASILSPRRWALWSVARRRWVGFALVCETAAVGVTVTSLAVDPVRVLDLVWFAALLAMGLAQAEMWRQIERTRRWMGGQTHINVTSIWCLAGCVLLSPGWAALLAAALYAHLWIRVWRHVNVRPAHRIVASAASFMLAGWAAAVMLSATGLDSLTTATPGPLHDTAVVVAAALVFELVNLAGAAAGIYLYIERPSLADLFGTRADNALEVVTLCLGGLVATSLVHQPALVLVTYPPLVLLHRQVLIKHLGVAVATDEKTGVFNNGAWHLIAERELDRAGRSASTFAVFMVDIDHFKRVNDTYGHLTGDAVLGAVASTISLSLRDADSVGRFGGEEFVVLLPDIAPADVDEIAERVRHAVTQLAVPIRDDIVEDLSVSVGTAVYPYSGTVLDGLLDAADAALLQAKRTGRNRVAHADGARLIQG
jgi:diguanylate cyclase (GGDEF)-like protein